MHKINWKFDNTYSKLSETFREFVKPTPVHNPKLVIFNHQLAQELNLDFSKTSSLELSEIFSGNILPQETKTLAQAYAGHQFGHFTMLGDGRAVLLGEHLDNKKNRYDIQFKGSGRTSFSRGGDGRAALGPMLREYIISEAIHYLNIPTTRSLSVIKTGEDVFREKKLQGSILTRIASSHIRVGTFQYAAAQQDIKILKSLFDYTVERHYSDIKNSEDIYIELLKESDVAIYVNIKTGAKLLIPIYASYGTETDDNCDCNLPNIGFDGINADVTAKFGDISNGPVFTLKNNLKLFGRNHRFFSEERDGVGGTQSFQDKLLFGSPDQNSSSTEAELKHLLANPHQLVKSSHSGDTLTAGMATKLGDFMFEGYLKGGIEFASFNMIMPDSDFVIGSYGAGILLRMKDRRNKIGLDFEQMGNISNEDKLKMSQRKLELSLKLKDMPRFYINNQKTSLALPVEDLPSPHMINSFNFGVEFKF